MKYVTFQTDTVQGPHNNIGIILDNEIIAVSAVYGAWLRDVKKVYKWRNIANQMISEEMIDLIEKAPISTDAVKIACDYYEKLGRPEWDSEGKAKYKFTQEEVRLLPPIHPKSMRDTSCFIKHMQEAARINNKPFNESVLHLIPNYRTSATNIAGPNDPILWPSHGTDMLDYECEFAFVIGKYGEDIKEENALDYIFGVTLYNDVSARDIQAEEKGLNMGPVKGKNFLNANILGPYLVTTDELDLHNMDVSVYFNNEFMGTDNSCSMYYSPEQIVEYVSQNDSLLPGEVLASGTVGPGTLGQFNRYLEEGDEIKFVSDALGCTLTNIVAPKPESFKRSRYPLK